mmetsp:Transcript_56010/g.141823  ORF Transcript_56010/g.141823 Transcript_56010/m.141823 type:complete len:94 (-) Transcript_56010:126-407(-)
MLLWRRHHCLCKIDAPRLRQASGLASLLGGLQGIRSDVGPTDCAALLRHQRTNTDSLRLQECLGSECSGLRTFLIFLHDIVLSDMKKKEKQRA